MSYTLDLEVLNLIFNLVLDKHNYELALEMFELIIDDKLNNISLENLNVPKTSLLKLLKIQTLKLRKCRDIRIDELVSEIDIMSQRDEADVYDIDNINDKYVSI